MDAEQGTEMQRISSSEPGEIWTNMTLGEIVKLLMMPVMSHGHSFYRDDAALLELYLTEAGIRLLEEGGAAPNFTEIGMVLQSYANNYSRKVDHVYHLSVHLRGTLYGFDCEESSAPETEAEPSPRRRRGASDSGGGGEFAPIVMTPAPLSARRAPSPAGPPPALPRQFSELAAREAREDRALHAYFDGESIGSLDDFHISRRTQRGYLVDELEADDEEQEEEEEPVQPLSLLQLQAAIERNAAGSPPPAPLTSPPASPRAPSPSPPPPPRTPPPELAPLATSTPLATPLRVRKRDLTIASVERVITLETNVEWAPPEREFEVRHGWVRRVVHARRAALLRVRRAAPRPPATPDFRGFDTSWMDIGGFRGWARAEAREACATARRLSAALLDSDDDGFFERSSSLSPSQLDPPPAVVSGAAEALSWQEDVARRAALAPPLDVNALARDVRRALVVLPAPARWRALLQGVRPTHRQPSHVLLVLLQDVTTGELEMLQGATGSIGEFSVRLPPAGEEPPDP